MRRNTIYISILDTIADNYMQPRLSAAEVSEYDSHKAAGEFVEMARILLAAVGCNANLKPLLKAINVPLVSVNEYESSVSMTGLTADVDIPHRKPSQERCFVYTSSEVSCLDSTKLMDKEYSEEMITMIERICCSRTRCKRLLSAIVSPNIHSYSLIYNKSLLGYATDLSDSSKEDLYSYCLLRYLNSGKTIPLHEDISGRTPTTFDPAVSFNIDVWYRQYLDIYDVLNEWQHTSDYIMAFLKMYQVMEFVAYRHLLIDIIKDADIQHSFLRSVKDLDTKYNKSERATFIKTLKPLYPDFSTCVPLVTVDVANKVEEYFGLDEKERQYLAPGMTDPGLISKGFLRFIYDVRCSIVHNKDSEFHITYSNFGEYEKLVPIMKELLQVIGKRTIELLSDHNASFSFKPVEKLDLF